jgi:hypothetical protein
MTTTAAAKNKREQEKKDKFRELAGKRTQRALDTLDVLGNCFNRNNYTYTPEQIEKIFEALETKFAEIKALTEPKQDGASARVFEL